MGDKVKWNQQINHYPARVMTFVERLEELKDQLTYRITSDYRGVYLETYFLIGIEEPNKISIFEVEQFDRNGD